MSLNIYIDGVDCLPESSIERDVEYIFKSVKLDGCEYDKAVLERIEKGSYLSNTHFIDRFGSKLVRDYMSTGVKAALVLYHNPEIILWGGEVGCNALTEIAKVCTVGNFVIVPDSSCVFGLIDDAVIDVNCRGKIYTSLNEFAEYLMEGNYG